jgi:hypothetical protein
MNKYLLIIIGIALFLVIGRVLTNNIEKEQLKKPMPHKWEFASIDTMKYSRDIAREKANDPKFDIVIERMVSDIAATGATHVAIATPYDPEFIPFLTRWVKAARRNNINVWFRGNFSGWEGWFDHPKINRDIHQQQLVAFIEENQKLFNDGDIFSPCPECENGGPGDPRLTGDVDGYRKFLIAETDIASKAFKEIGVNVSANYHSMNGDVARLIMDKETTRKLGGVVVIDHYVKTPDILVADIKDLASKSGGKIILGEFGAPIPDIHGSMTEEEQAEWINEALIRLEKTPEFVGVNYWVNTGGSTELWDSDGNKKKAVDVVTYFYTTLTTKKNTK